MQVVQNLRIIDPGGYSIKDRTLESCFLLKPKNNNKVIL